jgi:hypothetical protein
MGLSVSCVLFLNILALGIAFSLLLINYNGGVWRSSMSDHKELQDIKWAE